MSGDFLFHVTLTTGHAARSYRDEIRDESVAGAQDLLRRAMDERVPMLAFGPEFAITVTSGGRDSMIATIWDGLAPVVTFGVARTNRAGAGLWSLLLRASFLTRIAVDESARPQAPWVATRIEHGSAGISRDIMTAIEGLGGVIGWAFLGLDA